MVKWAVWSSEPFRLQSTQPDKISWVNNLIRLSFAHFGHQIKKLLRIKATSILDGMELSSPRIPRIRPGTSLFSYLAPRAPGVRKVLPDPSPRYILYFPDGDFLNTTEERLRGVFRGGEFHSAPLHPW